MLIQYSQFKMADIEFDILDELYFVETFETLQKNLNFEKNTLKNYLKQLLAKGWIKYFSENQEEIFANMTDFKAFDENFDKYSYLATKAGLTAHNTRW